MNILLHRLGAFGDALEATPVLRRLRRENPGAVIDVVTHNPAAFTGNPDATSVLWAPRPIEYDRRVILENGYESRPGMSRAEANMEAAFGDCGDPVERRIVYGSGQWVQIPEWLNEAAKLPVVAVHPNISWENRTLPRQFWGDVVTRLRGAGYTVVSLGTGRDHDLAEFGAIDTRDKLQVPEQAAVIAGADAFLCLASGLLPLSGATDTPVVALGTVSTWRESVPWRYGEQLWNLWPMDTSLPCGGCHDRRTGPIHHLVCEFGHNDCVRSFDPGRVVDRVEMAIRCDERKKR